eukprot:TRINITY_DN1065_c0_g1_i1.p1 TRINITY_DN1065_c0_g1~~TRINITY_DN1065_c0_g1_i1.p1  ORF type:complete len:432 (-),score=86.62 TRINITY_DN1065_c0_g1_i1:14-1309(-)
MQEIHPTLRIVVSNPEKHGEGVSGYVSFCVTTLTDLPTFKAGDGLSKIEVRRRYSDFVWLRNQLVLSNPEIIVPPIPQKLAEKFLDRFSGEFLEKRRKGLELFLNRVALHPSLIGSTHLNIFLCAKEWELKTAQSESEVNNNSNNANASALSLKIASMKVSKTSSDDPDLERFENVRKYFTNLQTQLLATCSNVELIIKKNQELITDYTGLSPTFLWLAESEAELSQPLSGVGRAYSEFLIPSLNELTQAQEYGLLQALQQYILTAEAGLEVLLRRDLILSEYLTAQRNLENLRAELLRTQHEQMNAGSSTTSSTGGKGGFSFFNKISFEDPQLKIQRLELKLEQDELALQSKKKELDRVTSILSSEIERFHKWKLHDFQSLLHDLVQSQMEFHRKVQQAFQNLKPEFNELNLENIRRTFWVAGSRQSLSE